MHWILLITMLFTACGPAAEDNQQSIIKLSVTTRDEVLLKLGQPILSEDGADGFERYCKAEEKCQPGIFTKVNICKTTCACIIRYDASDRVNSCQGCVEELCKI